MFLSVTGDVLDEAQQQALQAYVLGGGGFAGIHGALFGPSACLDKWAWYGELCGVSFTNHSAIVPATVNVEDRANPSTAALPEHWSRADEWYNYTGNPRGRAHVLATVDESTYKGGSVGQDHPIAWCKKMGQGTMWYTAMGHTDESFRDPLFLKHVLGGIQLAAGAKPADLAPNATPRPPLPTQAVAQINRMTSLFDGKTLDGWVQAPENSWTVKDGAMASLGTGRGVIYARQEFANFRLIFSLRHLGGPPQDHQAGVLIFCATPEKGQKGLDALGGIQFQPPKGWSWDYRPGKNNSGKGLFTKPVNGGFDPKEWFQVELLVNAEKGTARMAVAQPVGRKAIEVVQFNDPTAGRKGPIAWQMHNKGLFDEYRDIRVEVDPTEDRLITVE